MDEEFTKFGTLMTQAHQISQAFIKAVGDRPVPNEVREGIRNFNLHAENFAMSLNQDKLDSTLQSMINVGIYAQSIGQNINRVVDLTSEISNFETKFQTIGIQLVQAAQNSPLALRPLNSDAPSANLTPSYDSTGAQRALKEDLKIHDERMKKLFNENELRITAFESKVNSLEEQVKERLDRAVSLYEDGVLEIGGRRNEIEQILGHVSGRAIAGDYENSAIAEKNMADYLRYGSIFCMALIATAVGYSFWESTQRDFHWEISLVRFTLVFLLSVPAAYLARESAKHRSQQYAHLQTSLDLKAISPFLASLPEEEQHKLKIAIATKIFSGRSGTDLDKDSYPLDFQTIAMEVLKKIDIVKSK